MLRCHFNLKGQVEIETGAFQISQLKKAPVLSSRGLGPAARD